MSTYQHIETGPEIRERLTLAVRDWRAATEYSATLSQCSAHAYAPTVHQRAQNVAYWANQLVERWEAAELADGSDPMKSLDLAIDSLRRTIRRVLPDMEGASCNH